LKDYNVPQEAEKLMLKELEREMQAINVYLQNDESEIPKSSFETPVKKKKQQTETAIDDNEGEFSFFYETPTMKVKEDVATKQKNLMEKFEAASIEVAANKNVEINADPIEMEPAASKENIKVKTTSGVKTASVKVTLDKEAPTELDKKIEEIFNHAGPKKSSFSNYVAGDPNSLAYKLMEPLFPEHVKTGKKISVQKRLHVAKERLSSVSSNLSEVPYENLP
jgi:hypothetical protein